MAAFRLGYTCRTGQQIAGSPESRCVFRQEARSLTFDLPPSQTTRWRAVVRVLRSPVEALGCALLPASCSLCGTLLPRLSSVPICDACWAEIPALTGPACARCGDSLDNPHETDLCRACCLAPPPFVRAVAYGLYSGRMKDAIHALKYQRLHPAARVLGRMLAAAIAQLRAGAPGELLVIPIPLHRSRYAQRGFNQARALARAALESLSKTHPAWCLTLAPGTLMRHRATESQAGLNPRQRRINLRGAFTVSDPSAVAGKDILIVDDILTTGSTARAAAQALKRAGAHAIYVATLARARHEGYFRLHSADNAEQPDSLAGEASEPQATNLDSQLFASSSEQQRSFLHRSS